MKIAVVIDAWEPIVGGSQTHVWELSCNLIKNYDCRIDIYTRALIDFDHTVYNQDETHLEGKLSIIRVGPATRLANPLGRVLTIFTIARKLIKKQKKQNYDLIHAHSILGGLAGKIAAYCIRKPLLLTVHGAPHMGSGEKNFNYLIEKWILTRIGYDKVISVGKGFLKFPNVNKDIAVIPNGINISRFDKVNHVKKADCFKILFVGRLDWIKGVDTLIETVNILRDRYSSLCSKKNVQFHLIGYGFDVGKYQKSADNYSLNELLIFRGKITGEKLIKEYKSSRLLILTSISEGDGIVIKEAWAAKIPVLSTICNAPEYYIKEGDDGFLIEKQNPEKMAEAIVRILESPQQKLDEMGEKGYKKVCKNYTWDMVAKKTFDVYDSLAKH